MVNILKPFSNRNAAGKEGGFFTAIVHPPPYKMGINKNMSEAQYFKTII